MLEERRFNLPFVVTAIILVVVIVLSVVFYINTNNNFESDRKAISDLKAQVNTLQSQFTLASTQAATLQTELNAAKTQVSKLDGQLTTSNTQINSLNTQITSINNQIAALQKQVTDTTTLINSVKNDVTAQGAKITALETSVNSLNTKVTALEASVNTLKTQVDNLTTAATNPVTIASSISLSATNATPSYFASHVSSYTGYIQVTSNTALATGIIKLYYNSTANLLGDYAFNGGSTVSIPVSSGVQYLLYFGNSASSGSISAVLSATFYPGSSGGTNQTTIFSNRAISQSNGATTVVETFAATNNGYISISGTSSSSSTYIEMYNTTAPATTETKIFGTGTTLNFNVVAGNNYQIKFYNLNSGSGTVTATLTAIYNRY